MEALLSARVVEKVLTSEGMLAEVMVYEPNGDAYRFHCLCGDEETAVDGDGEELSYLNERYGDVAFCTTIRLEVMSDEFALPTEAVDEAFPNQ